MSPTNGFNIRSAIGATALVQAATIAAQIVVISALPRLWGSAGFGAWNTWVAAVGLLGALELGVGAFVGGRVVYLTAANRTIEAASTLLTSTLLALTTQMAAGAVALLAAYSNSWSIAHAAIAIGPEETSLLIVLASLVGIVGVCTGSAATILTTGGHYAFTNYVIALFRLLEAIALIVLAALGFGLVTVAAGQVCVKASLLLWLALTGRRRIAWASRSVALSKQALRETLSIVATGGLVTISAAATRDGLVLALAAWQGPLAVAAFTSLRTLCNGALQCFHVISQPITTAFAYRAGRQEHRMVNSIFRRLLAVACAGGALAAIAIGIGSDLILRSLTGNALRVDWAPAIVMALYCFLSIVFAALSSILVATGQLKALGAAYLGSAITAMCILFAMRNSVLAPSIAAMTATLLATLAILSPAIKAAAPPVPIAS